MNMSEPPALQFPAMLHGQLGTIHGTVRAKGEDWAREYIKTGGFSHPQRLLQVLPGETLVMHSAAEFEFMDRSSWRIHMLIKVITSLDENVPEEERQRAGESFESFCLSTPWGALYHAMSPPPPRSAARMARRLAALLRFWDVLEGPRYAYRVPETHHTLDGLVEYLYRNTLEAWCPGGPASVREHLVLTVERMACATQEDCMEAVLRMMPLVVQLDKHLKHREVLSDPGFLRERLTALAPKDFEDVSSAFLYSVSGPLCAWDRELGRRS